VSKAVLRRGLVDTALLLAILRADDEAVDFAMEMLKVASVKVSEFSAMVLLASSRDAAELADRQQFLKHNHVRHLTARTVRRARKLLTSLPLPTTLTADDAIVAATALEHSLPLYTLDPVRFAAVPGQATLQPY
jgi:predicted nucleic acid-binding protein